MLQEPWGCSALCTTSPHGKKQFWRAQALAELPLCAKSCEKVPQPSVEPGSVSPGACVTREEHTWLGSVWDLPDCPGTCQPHKPNLSSFADCKPKSLFHCFRQFAVCATCHSDSSCDTQPHCSGEQKLGHAFCGTQT